MLIDHITALFVSPTSDPLFHLTFGDYGIDVTWYVIGRSIGRIAFPIFAFLIAEGYFYTKDLKKYILRLSVFAVLSEIPYYYALCFDPVTGLSVDRRNIMFTLLLGLLAIAVLDTIHQRFMNQMLKNLMSVATIIGFSFLLIFIKGSYLEFGYGVLLMIGFYFGHYSKKTTLLLFILLVGFLRGGIEFMAILAAPFIYFYNGKKGPSLKYAFYAFYPVHLLVLYGINVFLTKN